MMMGSACAWMDSGFSKPSLRIISSSCGIMQLGTETGTVLEGGGGQQRGRGQQEQQ